MQLSALAGRIIAVVVTAEFHHRVRTVKGGFPICTERYWPRSPWRRSYTVTSAYASYAKLRSFLYAYAIGIIYASMSTCTALVQRSCRARVVHMKLDQLSSWGWFICWCYLNEYWRVRISTQWTYKIFFNLKNLIWAKILEKISKKLVDFANPNGTNQSRQIRSKFEAFHRASLNELASI